MKQKSLALAVIGLTCAIALPAYAEDKHDQHNMNHDAAGMQHSSPLPTEGGQAGFTAIAEIVALLNEDPNTDWTQVNMDKLRSHLVDMNEVTVNAEVTRAVVENGVVFNITGEERTLQAAKAMVPAHAVELNKISGWHVEVETQTGQVIMSVTADDGATFAKIKALGFFGLMATGAHHQAHHWGMATGTMAEH